MRKAFTASFLVLGLFLTYAYFGAGIRSASADRGEDGREQGGVEIRSGSSSATSSVSDGKRGESDDRDNEADEIDDEDVRSTSSLGSSIKHREEELKNEASSTEDNDEKDALNDHNGMRVAVHALLASKNLLGGIGPQVSEIAKSMNDTVSSTIEAETKINSRGWLKRVLFGGDKENAAKIIGQVNQNQERITRIEQLVASCTNCSTEVKTMLTDRLKLAEEEQVRLEALAKSEEDIKGLFSIFSRLFGK